VKTLKDKNPPNFNELTWEETTFYGLFKKAGGSTLKNWTWFWAAILTIGFGVFFTQNSTNLQEDLFSLSSAFAGTLLGAAAGIFGIVIAALTITITLFRKSLLPIMLRENLLQKFLFPFWFLVVLWAANIVLCVLLFAIQVLKQKYLTPFIFFLELFLFLYATFYTVRLTGLVIRLALQNAQIEEE
jgi:hypothetical protein